MVDNQLHRYEKAQGRFRLFTIDKACDQGIVQLTLEEFDNGEIAPAYEAVSYVWNEEAPCRPVICNGQTLIIRPSLEAVLLELRRQSHNLHLWVDAICIDQEDEIDKSMQVPKMGTYFSEADSVLIWLGPGDRSTDLALDMIPVLSRRLQEVDTNEHPSLAVSDSLEMYELPAKSSDVWIGLGAIFSRKWFSRMWTLQEIGLAKSASLYCGQKSVDWHMFASMISKLVELRLDSLVQLHAAPRIGGFSRVRLALFCVSLGVAKAKGQPLPLSVLADWIRVRSSTEPVDKIYGLLGLMKDELRQRITVDYSSENRTQYWRSYMALGHALLKERSDLFILTQASSIDRPPYMPTWCPNFNCPRAAAPLTASNFSAGGPCTALTPSPLISTSQDGGQLITRGISFDTVEVVVNSSFPTNAGEQRSIVKGAPAQCLSWLEDCKQLAASAGMDHDALLRVITANTLLYPAAFAPSRTELGESYERYIKWLHALEEHEKAATSPEQPTPTSAEFGATRFLTALYFASTGRKVFKTSAGRLGIGPASVNPGDVVVVYETLFAPIILRPKESESTYELVGESYVHGVMHGEVLQNETQDNKRLYVIT